MSMPAAALKVDPWSAWWQSWWNVETLGPDLVVGLVTGGAVGVVVLLAEKRMASRSVGREVANAQAAIVEKARSVLRHDVHFLSRRGETLHLDRSLIDGLSDMVRAMPAGLPAQHVPGYRWVRDFCHAVAETEALADALDSMANAIDYRFGNADTLGLWIRRNIVQYAETDPAELDNWGWDWHPQLPAQGTASVAADVDLWLLVQQYARQRRLIVAYRAAFLVTMEYLRKGEREAERLLREAHGSRFRVWRARRAAQSALVVSRAWADSQAEVFVTDVDPDAV